MAVIPPAHVIEKDIEIVTKTSLDQGTGIGIDSSIVLKNQDQRDNTTTDLDAILALGLFDTP